MTKKDDEARVRRAEEHTQEVEGALNLMLEAEITRSAATNALTWLLTVGAAFALNLLLLLLATG